MKSVSCLLLLGVLLVSGAAHAQFAVDKVEARLLDEGIRVQADLILSLTDATEEALSQGVPLIVVHEITLNRNGWLWNSVEQRASQRHRLRYHALSGRYVVEGDDAALETFRSLNDALEFINSAAARFDAPRGDGRYTVAVRSRLDINALPAPLRPTALFSPQWQLSSDWSQWPVSDLLIN